MSPYLTEQELQDIKAQLSDVETHGDSAFTSWLKSAFFTHKSQIKHLLHELDELRDLFIKRLSISPLSVRQVPPELCSVREAQLLKVCRLCLKSDSCRNGDSLVLRYGEEYAHMSCLNDAAYLHHQRATNNG